MTENVSTEVQAAIKYIKPFIEQLCSQHCDQNHTHANDTPYAIDQCFNVISKAAQNAATLAERVMELDNLAKIRGAAAQQESCDNIRLKAENERLREVLRIARRDIINWVTNKDASAAAVAYIDKTLTPSTVPSNSGGWRPYREYHEDHGFVLWHLTPVNEPPYVGNDLCSDWPYEYTGQEARLFWCKLPSPPTLQSTDGGGG